MIHLVSQKPDQIDHQTLFELLDMLSETIDKHELRANLYKNLAYSILELALLLICHRCDLMTKEIQEKFIAIWHHKKFIEFTKATVENELTSSPSNVMENQQQENEIEEPEKSKQKILPTNFIFSNIISCRFIHMMEDKSKENFHAYAEFLCQLLKHKFIDIENVNEQVVRLYQEDWKMVRISIFYYM